MQSGTRLRKGDVVQVMTGRSKGKTGKVLKIDERRQRVFVEKTHMVKRHMKPSKQHPQGGLIEKESAIHWSNVMLVDGKTGKPTRIRMHVKDGVRERVAVKSGQVIGN